MAKKVGDQYVRETLAVGVVVHDGIVKALARKRYPIFSRGGVPQRAAAYFDWLSSRDKPP